MAAASYPLLCWQLDEDAVFGMLLGTDIEAVERNARRLRSTLAEHLKREIERDAFVPDPDVDEARLKLVTVQVNLAHRTARGSFPLPTPVEFRVAAVHGDNEEDAYSKCWLPYLGQSFYYYDAAQLGTLIEHYTREVLDGLSPEDAQRYLMSSPPWLELVPARRREPRASRHAVPRHLREVHAALSTVADRLPETGTRRGLHVVPETAWEQTALVDEVAAQILRGANVLLVGEPGVGKSVVIMDAVRKAHRLAADREPPPVFWRSHAERLIGRAKYLGEWQALCDELVRGLEMLHGVLWVTDFLQLLQVGGDGAEDSMAAYLLPAVRRGALRLIGEANPSELDAARQRLPGFVDCFEPIRVAEMDGARARRVLGLFAGYAQSALKVRIDPAALDTSYRLLERYVRYESFPGKAVRFLGECVRRAIADDTSTVTEAAAIAGFVARTGLPEVFLRDDRPLVEAELHAFFAQRLFGQAAAINTLKDAIYLFKAGLNNPAKPIATLLLAGPTGVGKTAAAKALAEYFFGAGAGPPPGRSRGGPAPGDTKGPLQGRGGSERSERGGTTRDPLFRIDMSEFQHAFQIARLIGTATKPGTLVEHVRHQPFSVLLLDEIEKADPSVFDLLLNVLDEGRLRDGRGRLTDFRSTLIVMTTNLGVRHGASLGFASGDTADGIEHEIRRFFRPEFYNRIDRVVRFEPLSREAIDAITRFELESIAQREGLLRRGVTLRFTPRLIDFIAGVGFSPKYGARPLQRAIEQHVVAALARRLFDAVPDGSRLEVDVIDGAVVVGAALSSGAGR